MQFHEHRVGDPPLYGSLVVPSEPLAVSDRGCGWYMELDERRLAQSTSKVKVGARSN